MSSDEQKPKLVSRRFFIKGAAVGAAVAGAGAIAACTTAPTPAAAPAPTAAPAAAPAPTSAVQPVVAAPAGAKQDPYLEKEETRIQTYCQIAAVDVKNGKIVRMRPLHYDAAYTGLKPFSITARGKTLTFPLKSTAGVYAMGMSRRTTSPNRVLYPLKRVDWEPGGDPAKINAQNRGKSKYKRITWDEATTIIASELKRVADKYGPAAICDLYLSGHNEGHSVEGLQ